MKKCVICNVALLKPGSHKNPKGWSEEHCTPLWLQRHLGVASVVHVATHQGPEHGDFIEMDDGAPSVIEKSPSRHVRGKRGVHGRVCYECNNIHFGQLETQIQGFLIPFVDGEKTLEALTHQQRRSLGEWTLKTLFMHADADRRAGIVIPPEHVQHLKNKGEVPPGVVVFGISHGFPGTEAVHISRDFQVQLHKYSVAEWREHLRTTYKASLLLGKIILMVAYIPPVLGSHFAIWPGVHHRIWPPGHDVEVPWTLQLPRPPVTMLVSHLGLFISEITRWDPEELVHVERGDGSSVLVQPHERKMLEVGEALLTNVIPWGAHCPCGSGKSFRLCHGQKTDG